MLCKNRGRKIGSGTPDQGVWRMHRIKEFLQKKKGLGPVAALVLLAAVLGLAIALRAGKLENRSGLLCDTGRTERRI